MLTDSSSRVGAPDDEHQTLDLSVVIPCLNEARTVGGCVEAALDGIRASGLSGEVVVADNGSIDGSREIAQRAGARVVAVPRRGYGAALQAGFHAAQGRLMVMGDADLSYDFREIPKFVDEQRRTGADVVVGDRLGGHIEPGAMPWTHQRLGNPLISLTIRRFFNVPVHDCYCGLRMITRDAFDRLRLNANSMEFALEMIVQGSLVGLSFAQVPITLHVDGRDHAPHLRTMRDGYRSFRFIFQHAPITAYYVPGLVAALAGLAMLGVELWRESQSGQRPTALAAGGAALLLTGWLVVILGIVARVFVIGFLDNRVDPPLRRFFRWFNLETAVLLSLLSVVVGILLAIVLRRLEAGLQLGLTLIVGGVLTFVATFVVSLIGRAIPDDRMSAPASSSSPPAQARGAPREDPAVAEARRAATKYRAWQVDILREVWDNGAGVLGIAPYDAFAELVAGRLVEAGRPGAVVALDHGETPTGASRALHAAEPFDAALIFDTLAAIDDDVEALRAVAARVRPGGLVGLVLPGGGDRLFGPLDEAAGRRRRYRAARLRSRLQMAGLDVVWVRPIDGVGALAWFWKVRIARSRSLRLQEVETYERAVPVLRRIDALTGPPFGRRVAAIARVPEPQPTPSEPASSGSTSA